MIRRDPTLIPMSDSDVQDVRDMVAKDLQNQKVQSLPFMSEEQRLLFEKAERLGLQPEQPVLDVNKMQDKI